MDIDKRNLSIIERLEELRDLMKIGMDKITLQDAMDEIERLREKYEEAIDDIEEWGAYASEYFQEKWELKECIEQHRAALKEAE